MIAFYQPHNLDPQLGRFAQVDRIVPGGVQGLDRYAYVNNNPLKYTDPSGHDVGSPGKDASEAASDIVIMIACGVKDGSCGYNTDTMNPAYDYAVKHGYQAYFYDPDNYNQNYAKYETAQAMADQINDNPDDNFYIVGYSAGADATILATDMTGYSNNIQGVGLIDPYLSYTNPSTGVENLQTQANTLTSEGVTLALADSPMDDTTVSISGAIVPQPPQPAFNYEHGLMGTEQSVFTFIFESIFK